MEDFNTTEQNNSEGFSVDTFNLENLEETAEEKISTKKTLAEEVFDWVDMVAFAVIAVVIIFSLVFRVATISGPSMQNTLHSGEQIIITNFAYEPKQGDIVVVSRNTLNSAADTEDEGPIIKRVIAVGGQTVDIDFEEGIVYVDGVALKEDYISTPTTRKFEVDFPVYVPEGNIFVLGDNRGNSLDSRSDRIGENGLIDTRYVLGHAIFRFLPFDRIGRLDNK